MISEEQGRLNWLRNTLFEGGQTERYAVWFQFWTEVLVCALFEFVRDIDHFRNPDWPEKGRTTSIYQYLSLMKLGDDARVNDAEKARTLEAVYVAIHDALAVVSVEEVLRVGDQAVRDWTDARRGVIE